MPHSHKYARLSVYVRVVLLLAVWTGPLPYFHCHGSLLNAVSMDSLWLFNHLSSSHRDAALCEDVDFGWHIHFGEPGSEKERRLAAKWLSLGGGGTETATVVGDARAIDWLTSPDFSVASALPGSPEPRSCSIGAFHSTYAVSLPLPLRFGVVRC
ncbi:hypothetical protein AB1L30_11855 [Bremerella sp. JC817]|uniref:hypothetical protein n=1 Tax=Bremerella sp. JC817 TaxID=3231756 RepID=UPI0034580D18